MFSPQYVLDSILPLAVASYGQEPYPAQWKVEGKIAPQNTGAVVQYSDLATGKTTVAICVSGTEDLEQWRRDFDAVAMPNPYGAGRVHRGLCLWQQALRNSVWDAIYGVHYDELILIGHSAGGAIVVNMAMDIAKNAPEYASRVVGYTFESPKAGDAEFVADFNSKFPNWWRIQNVHDIIPTAPPPPIYEHEGTTIWIDGGMPPPEEMSRYLHWTHGLMTGCKPGLEKLIRCK